MNLGRNIASNLRYLYQLLNSSETNTSHPTSVGPDGKQEDVTIIENQVPDKITPGTTITFTRGDEIEGKIHVASDQDPYNSW